MNTHVSPPGESTLNFRSPINRTRTGCRTCRHRKIKCDEKKPICTQCGKGMRTCNWPEPGDKRTRLSRRPNLTACDACRQKKLKRVGDVQNACDRCSKLKIDCIHSQQDILSAPSSPAGLSLFNDSHVDAAFPAATLSPTTIPAQMSQYNGSGPFVSEPNILDRNHETLNSSLPTEGLSSVLLSPEPIPTGKELQDLVQLYFSSVHHFGFFTFIHQLQFNRLLSTGAAPRELTLMMIASAMRFAAEATPDNLARADSWADAAIGALLPRVYQGFGAIQLMTLLLAQHYDLNRGNFTSAWLLGANCTRMMQMMSLQTFDRTYPWNFASSLRLSPLLSCEALRRVAWCTFYIDTIVDGGRYGFHIVDEKAYRLQLPCDQASFLGNEMVMTESLSGDFADLPNSSTNTLERAPLDISAYLLRTAAARRRALHFAFRASHKEETAEQLSAQLSALEADMEAVIAALPKRFQFTTDNMFLHRDRLITFILLHILRHNVFIVVGRAALQVYQRDSAKANLVPQVRRNRISHALPIAGLISEGLKAGISFDPQIGVQAYVALEILLFEPRRLAGTNPFIDPKSPEVMEAIPHLLKVIRALAGRSEFVKQLHIEAVHRLLRCDCTDLLEQADFAAFRSEYRLVGQDAAEYDFRDFRWAKLERLRRGARSSANAARDEALLEYKIGAETAAPSVAPSPRLDAIHVNNSLSRLSDSQPPLHVPPEPLSVQDMEHVDSNGLAQSNQPWWGVDEPDTSDQAAAFNWSYFLDESGNPDYQTGDPTLFWSQLEQN